MLKRGRKLPTPSEHAKALEEARAEAKKVIEEARHDAEKIAEQLAPRPMSSWNASKRKVHSMFSCCASS